MSRDRRVPDEPDYRALLFPAAVVAEFEIPPPEVYVPEEDEPPPDTPAAPAAETIQPPRPCHPVLEALLERRDRGELMAAWQGFEQLAAAVDGLPHPGADDELLWLRATQLAFDTARQAGQTDHAIARLRQNLERFRRPPWTVLRQETGHYFVLMIRLALRTGRESEALDIYRHARRQLELVPELRRELVDLAVRLDQADAGTAWLCLEELETGAPRATDEAEAIFRLIRRAIRVDLTVPAADRLDEHRELNLRAQRLADLPWTVAHIALADLRSGRRDRAVQHARQVPPDGRVDAETMVALGLVFYGARLWSDATARFEQDGPLPPDRAAERDLYRRLCGLNRLLDGEAAVADRAALSQQLDAHLRHLPPLQGARAEELDAAWVAAAALAVLRRDDDAVRAFGSAPPQRCRWAHLQFAREAFTRSRPAAEFDEWLDALEPHAGVAVRLTRSRAALDRMNFTDAEVFLQAAEAAHAPALADDPDLEGARRTLHEELRLSDPSPAAPSEDAPPSEPEPVSGALTAWRHRVRVQQHLERGEFDAAEHDVPATPVAFLSPDEDVARLAALRRALAEDDESAGAVFAELADRPAASLSDRLHWGLWLCGRGETAQALPLLEELHEALPDSLECRLALAQCRIDHPGEVCALLEPLSGLAEWQTARRLALYRPWARKVDPVFWSERPPVSPHRVADMLHAADLALECGWAELALTLVEHLDALLGDRLPVLEGAVGERLHQAALVRLAAGALDEACELHQRATDRGVDDPDFAERLAEAVSGEESGSDAVLDVLFAWLVHTEADEAAALQSPVGEVFERFLFVDDQTPESPREFDRHSAWSERLHAARPTWEAPRRNLARAAGRRQQHERVLELTAALRELQPDDHRLRGHALWALGRFDAAGEAFEHAQEPGWVGCARAAARFQRLQSEPDALPLDEADALLVDLNWDACDVALAPQVMLWHAAVLTAAEQGEPALAIFEQLEASGLELTAPARLLRGLALLSADRPEDALELWRPDLESAAVDPQEGPLWLLVRLQDLAHAAVPSLSRDLQQMRRLGLRGEAFFIVEAELALRLGRTGAAAEFLEAACAAAATEEWDVILAPVRRLLRAERDFVAARLAMQRGDHAAAADALERLAHRRPWPESTQYWQAVGLLHSGQSEAGRRLLAELLERNGSLAAAHAQWALSLLSTDETAAAESHARQALALEPFQPFALIALARVFEARGETVAARETYERLLAQDPLATGDRPRAAALLALGRLEQQAGDAVAAIDACRHAAALRPESAAAQRRLGLLLALQAQGAGEWQEADAVLTAAQRLDSDDLLAALARVYVADRLGQPAETAARFEELLRVERFRALPADVRRALARRGADLQLELRRYQAAAEALERLLADDPSPALHARLLHCRLLQAMQVLRRTPLPDGALAEVRQAAEAVCAGPNPPAVAVLLRGLTLVLSGECRTTEEARALCDEIDALEPLEAGLSEWAAAVRRLAAPDADRAAADPWIDLLAANVRKDLPALQSAARRLAEDEPGSAGGPFNLEDLVLVGALADAAGNAERACELLDAWHRRPTPSPRSRLLHSQLLAQRAVKSLKLKKLGETRRLLHRAVNVLEVPS